MKETPQDLGLPKKFKGWREGQYEAITAVRNSDKTVFLLDGPPGVGKSAIGLGSYSAIGTTKRVIDKLAGHEQHRYRCIYLTRTKQLQAQVFSDFPRAKTIKGRSNYPCAKFPDKFPDITAEDCEKKCNRPCAYYIAKNEALSAPVAVLNEAYFLAEANGPGQFSGADFIILDEVDSLEASLLSFIQFTITERQLKRLKLEPPALRDKPERWLAWADTARAKAALAAGALRETLENLAEDEWTHFEIDLHRQATKLGSFVNKLNSFLRDVNESWIFDYEEGTGTKAGWKVTFKPIAVADYAERYLWRHGDRFLGMSGTIFDAQILANDLGVPDWEYHRMDSPYPVENRPIYLAPEDKMVNLKYSTMAQELPKLTATVAALMRKYPDTRVLVHTVSYHLRDHLMKHLPQGRLMTHDSDNREDALELFKTTTGPAVMISPSFDRGVDLPHEACRCVIICKIPYLGLSDKQVKARMKWIDGQRWYNLRAAQSLVQMSGRAVRAKDDHCDTWILDRQFYSLLARTRHIIPKWWQDAVKKGEL